MSLLCDVTDEVLILNDKCQKNRAAGTKHMIHSAFVCTAHNRLSDHTTADINSWAQCDTFMEQHRSLDIYWDFISHQPSVSLYLCWETVKGNLFSCVGLCDLTIDHGEHLQVLVGLQLLAGTQRHTERHRPDLSLNNVDVAGIQEEYEPTEIDSVRSLWRTLMCHTFLSSVCWYFITSVYYRYQLYL